MKQIFTIIFACSALTSAFSQTVGMDFNTADCNGNTQHLFADLDQGNAVIIEFFMLNCGSCIVAGNKLEAMKTDLEVQFPGKIKSYAIGFSDSYTCTNISNWVTSNSFTSIPMDKGGAQVAYYGGMGMPTVVVLGGTDHKVLGSPYIGLQTSDTSLIANSIRTLFGAASLGINESKEMITGLDLFPNPSSNQIQLKLTTTENVQIEVLDLNGRLVMDLGRFENMKSQQFDLSSLNRGSYLMRVQSEKAMTIKKFTLTQ